MVALVLRMSPDTFYSQQHDTQHIYGGICREQPSLLSLSPHNLSLFWIGLMVHNVSVLTEVWRGPGAEGERSGWLPGCHVSQGPSGMTPHTENRYTHTHSLSWQLVVSQHTLPCSWDPLNNSPQRTTAMIKSSRSRCVPLINEQL